MRRWLLLLILIVILVVLILLDRASATLHPVVGGDGILYAADFEQYQDEWQQYDDGRLAAQMVDGALEIRVDDPNSSPFSLARYRFADFDMQVTTQAVEGTLNNSYGVAFRLQTQDNAMLADDNYYLFLISSDGFYSVIRRVNGEDKFLSAWILSDVVEQGLEATNTLRVVAQGDAFSFFINNQLVQVCVPNNPEGESTYFNECIDGEMRDTLTDTVLGQGQVGMIAQTLGEAGVAVQFDELVVIGG